MTVVIIIAAAFCGGIIGYVRGVAGALAVRGCPDLPRGYSKCGGGDHSRVAILEARLEVERDREKAAADDTDEHTNFWKGDDL
jgi:hypothetical protein